jgi:hypothetical protein
MTTLRVCVVVGRRRRPETLLGVFVAIDIFIVVVIAEYIFVRPRPRPCSFVRSSEESESVG